MTEPNRDSSTGRPGGAAAVLEAAWCWVLVAGLVWLIWRQLQPPPVIGADAPAEVFSAERAMRHVEAIARRPRPTGSAEIARVRAYLVQRLRELGHEPREARYEIEWPPGSGRRSELFNIELRVRGEPGGKAVMLVAHYDSVPMGPGAGDNAAAVAAALETLRALGHRPPLSHDLIVLLSDGEELNLLGARAFADRSAWLKDVAVVLNFDARGTSGPTLMFETAGDAAWAVRQYAEAAPAPVTTSLATEVYRRMPNDSDFSVFRGAGPATKPGRRIVRGRGVQWAGLVAGLNFAFIGGGGRYHTPLDTPAHLDPRSVQHHGATVLALVEHFGRMDLSVSRSRGAANGIVYFTAARPIVVIYSGWWAAAFAVAMLLLGLETFRRAVHRGIVSWRQIRLGAGLMAVELMIWPLLATVVVLALPLSYPSERSLMPDEAQGRLYLFGLIALAAGARAATLAALHERLSPAAQQLAALAWCGLLAIITTWAVPGASYLFLWPTMAGLIGFTLMHGEGTSVPSAWRRMGGVTLMTIVTTGLLAPTAVLITVALTIRSAWAPMALIVLMLGLLTPLIERMTGRWTWPAAGAAGLAGAGLLAAGALM